MLILFILHLHAVQAQIKPIQLKDFYSRYIDLDFQVEAGYRAQQNQGLFYQLVYQAGKDSTSITDKTPLFIWLEGGPGCSSQSALYDLVGPFSITKQGQDYTFAKNPQSWNHFASILFIDQPFNTGFSYSDRYLKTTPQAADHYMEFIADFLTLHLEFQLAPLYLVGFSYSGHFVPYFAQKMLEKPLKINYKGIIYGNGLTDTFNQIGHSMAYLYSNGLIDETSRDAGILTEAAIQQNILNDRFEEATDLWDEMLELYSQQASIDTSNIDRRTPANRDTSWFDFVLDNRNTFGLPASLQPNICNDQVEENFKADISISFKDSVLYLLSKGRTLVYNGQMDWGIHTGGVLTWLNDLQHPTIYEWKKTTKKAFKLDSSTVGTVKSTQQFTYVSLYGAGHIAIKDRPGPAYAMIKHFLNNDEYWV